MREGTRRVFCIGETVLDIIFRDNLPISAKPGGSMLNTAVSLGRTGIPVHFISDFGMDQPGDIIHDFLVQNEVNTMHIDRYKDGKTALALAFLDEHQDAHYSFYKQFPQERLNISFPVIGQEDMILFGSFYALTPSIRKKLTGFIRYARSKGAFILYDPNFREAHLSELESLRPWIIENMSMANLVRGSDEDFQFIFGASDATESFRHVINTGCPMLVYTRKSENIEVKSADFHHSYAVPPVIPVSTIGAGDAFNAGILFAMSTTPTLSGSMTLSGSKLEALINTGIRFSANVCQSLDNYISVDFANQLIENNL
jgi:fructokinase